MNCCNTMRRVLFIILGVLIPITILLLIFNFLNLNPFDSLNKIKQIMGKVPVSESSSVLPVVRTPTLEKAYLGKYYKGDVIVTLDGFNESLDVKITDIPDGIRFDTCNFSFDSKLVPVNPNTVAFCQISGVPRKSGFYTLQVSAGILGGDAKSTGTSKLEVVD